MDCASDPKPQLIRWRPHAIGSLLVAVGFFLFPLSASASLLEGAVMQAADSMELRGALLHGKLDKIRSLATRHDDAGSLLARAYLAELEGNLEEAQRFVSVARGQAVGDDEKIAVESAYGRLVKASGDWERAERHYRKVLSEHPDAYRIRVGLGELLIEQGDREEAETILDKLSHDFNAGRIDSADGLFALGQAMALLGSFKDANHAFQLGFEKDSQHLSGLVAWAELFLSKYNTADAEKTFKDVLDINKRHPEALVGMAQVVMETKNYFDEAREYLDRAEKVHPGSPSLLLTRAELAIFDEDWDGALALTKRVLDQRPKHLDALAHRAAIFYLKDDREAFEKVKKRALAINPEFAGLYTTTAEYAVLVHRYEEGVELNRKALELKKGDAKALLGLGIGLSRVGKLDRAVTRLKEAFNADRYNVRAYNMLQFFEQTMPEYSVFRHERFLLRSHPSQAKVIDALIAPLVSESIEVYRGKYGFDPAESLSVEVYPNPESFGVRTVGLPHISPHGICFGRVVATRSPSDGNFNWKQVVWHEMAHVFHIQEADYRVPRWFTEGLAEYETNVKDPAWIRHHEPRIAAALRDDDIPSIVDLDRRFTQAKSYVDILQAYHLSSLVIHFIVDEWSFESINQMIEVYPEKIKTARVIRETFDISVEAFDQKFREWLSDRLLGFKHQLLINVQDFPRPSKLEETTRPSARDGWYHARMAVGKLRKGKAEAAAKSMERALQIGSKDPRVQYVASAFYANRGRAKKAYQHGMAVLDAGRDDYGLRIRLGRLSRILEDRTAAEIHLKAAIQLYPDGAQAWKQLLKLAESSGDAELKRRAVRRLFELDQTAPLAAKRYTELAIQEKRWKDAEKGVERWLAIQPFETDIHRKRARVSLHNDQPDDAYESWGLLAHLRPQSGADVWLDAVDKLSEYGFSKLADRAASKALEAGATEAEIDAARD